MDTRGLFVKTTFKLLIWRMGRLLIISNYQWVHWGSGYIRGDDCRYCGGIRVNGDGVDDGGYGGNGFNDSVGNQPISYYINCPMFGFQSLLPTV